MFLVTTSAGWLNTPRCFAVREFNPMLYYGPSGASTALICILFRCAATVIGREVKTAMMVARQEEMDALTFARYFVYVQIILQGVRLSPSY